MTKRKPTIEPPFDIILVGATGYVGALIADVLAAWAGGNRSRLRSTGLIARRNFEAPEI